MLGLSSDIGKGLAQRFHQEGCFVAGTYRNPASLGGDSGALNPIPCDVSDSSQVAAAIKSYSAFNRPWDVFVSAVGTELPIGSFFDVDFDTWERSIVVNATAQLRVLHGLYPHRRPGTMCHVGFLAGGGTNGPLTQFSAYCASKILLIKMCELLDDENPDLNVFIVGPGFVRTKIHKETLAHARQAGRFYQRTIDFLNTNPGTSLDEIYQCIRWCIRKGRPVAGGRNFSVVHDPWRDKDEGLEESLRGDPHQYKLRRYRNDHKKSVQTFREGNFPPPEPAPTASSSPAPEPRPGSSARKRPDPRGRSSRPLRGARAPRKGRPRP